MTELQMSFWDHLEELRWVVFKCLGTLVITSLVCLVATEPLWAVLRLPLLNMPVEVKLIEGGPVTPFIMRLKLALLGGIVLGIPFLLYFIWGFVSPGLRKQEKVVVRLAVLVGSVFFVFGACFGYVVMFFGLPALQRMGLSNTEAVWTIREYTSICFRFLLAFGVIFELPVVLVALARLGLVKADRLAKARPYAVLGVFVLAALLTPPDPFTQIMLGIPLVVLYELSIVVARFVQPE